MTYVYKCDQCGKESVEFRQLDARNQVASCDCGGLMWRDRLSELQGTSVRGEFKKPIVSESMGFPVEEVTEHREKFPDVDLEISEGFARPILRSEGQRRKYLKGRGWIDWKSFN